MSTLLKRKIITYEAFVKDTQHPDNIFVGQSLTKNQLDKAFNVNQIPGQHFKFLPLEHNQQLEKPSIHIFFDRQNQHFTALLPKHEKALNFEP